MTTYRLSRSKCSSSQHSNWERRKQVINVNNKLNGIKSIPYNDKFTNDKIFTDRPLANFHGIEFNGLRSPISHTHFWSCMHYFSSQLQPCHAQLLASKSRVFFFLLRGESRLFSFVCWSSLTTPLKPETPGPSHLSNSHQLCVECIILLLLSGILYSIASFYI